MWPLRAADLADIVTGTLTGEPEAVAHRVTTDTRAGVRRGDAFVGLRGEHFDGAAFAQRAFDAGASVVVSAAELSPPPGCASVQVDDPLAALQALAGRARDAFRGTVVGVTGSNGKTTVKDMLANALSPSVRVYASPQSYNSQVGVALTLLNLDDAADVAIVECGISRPGEMARLRGMVRPDVGILVNVGDAHLDGLGTRAVTAREKASLFADLPDGAWVLAPEDDTLALQALRDIGAPVRPVATTPPSASVGLDATTRVPLPAHLAGHHIAADAALAAHAAWRLGGDAASIETGLARWAPAPMRMELTVAPNGVLIINDAYTADPVSTDAALRALAAEAGDGHTIAVLSGMAQLGEASTQAHRAVGARVVELGIDRLIGVGQGGADIVAAALDAGMPPHDTRLVDDVRAAADAIDELAAPGDRVLLKGSRPARLEAVADALFAGLAPTRLYVDLDGLVDNYLEARSVAGDGCVVMPVIKSSGYGMSAVRVARALEKAGATWFAVAYPDEGISLRRRGVTAAILVQNVLPDEAAKVVRYGLSSCVGDADIVRHLADAARAWQRPARVHLEVDTGMGRTGATPDEAIALAGAVARHPELVLEGLMTHFASADDAAHDAFTRAQIAAFDRVVEALRPLAPSLRWIHASNTAGLSRFPQARYTMARLGIGLYGYGPIGGDARLPQRPVLRLVTRVLSTHQVEVGATVGYGRTWVADRPSSVAAVALGYNDGYPRALSNRGWMVVGGVRCAVVGRVCMDVTMIDVTDVPGGVRTGDEVVVFGPGPDEPALEELAALSATIPYELMTRLAPRVRRIYATTR